MTISGVVLILDRDAVPAEVRARVQAVAEVQCESGPDPLLIPACYETTGPQRAEAVLRELEQVHGIERVNLVFASSELDEPFAAPARSDSARAPSIRNSTPRKPRKAT